MRDGKYSTVEFASADPASLTADGLTLAKTEAQCFVVIHPCKQFEPT